MKELDVNKPDESWSIDQLISEFTKLTNNTEKESSLTLEEKKLTLMQAFAAKLKKISTTQAEDEKSVKQNAPSRWKRLLRNAFYYFLLSFGTLENASGNYLFGSFLFELIPGISNPASIVSSLIYTLLSSILFYGFEVSMLKDALGISYSNGKVKKLIDTYSNQLKTLSTINGFVSSLSMLKVNDTTYAAYIKFYMLLKEEQQKTYEQIGKYKESTIKKALKTALIAFGALSTGASSYFFMMSTLTAIAPALIGTPVGWIIICLTILGGLGFYYAMGGSGMARLANQDYYYYQDLKKEIETFNDNYAEDMQQMTELRSQFVERPTIDEGIQTEPEEPYQKAGLKFFDDVVNGGLVPDSTITLGISPHCVV